MAQQNTIESIITSDAVYTGCGEARQIPDGKLLPCSIYDVLTQSSTDLLRSVCRGQCRQTLAVVAWHSVDTMLSCLTFAMALELVHCCCLQKHNGGAWGETCRLKGGNIIIKFPFYKIRGSEI